MGASVGSAVIGRKISIDRHPRVSVLFDNFFHGVREASAAIGYIYLFVFEVRSLVGPGCMSSMSAGRGCAACAARPGNGPRSSAIEGQPLALYKNSQEQV